MMSKKQWFVLLCLLIIYLLVGASFFYTIETAEETARHEHERKERKEIEELLRNHYIPLYGEPRKDIFEKLSAYCGKPLHENMSEIKPVYRWDFYHSLFFVITVVSTIGYGNLAPTTMLGRIVMIFYGLVGIPINGIVMITLGEFFGKKFTKLYNHYKTDKMHDITSRLGLIGQITIYLIPGFTLFIFIPSVIIMVFEGWEYDVAVYYAFVTLTTIGFGDFVAGVTDNDFGTLFFTSYKVFLLVWIIIGLGYVVMLMGFISRGMRSKQVQALEHMLAQNLKRTPNKLKALKSLIHEIMLLRLRPVYKKQSIFVPHFHGTRSLSCPDLRFIGTEDIKAFERKRCKSETYPIGSLQRTLSDTNLNNIDKELTFSSLRNKKQAELLLRVSNVLGDIAETSQQGINCFTDSQILESEKYSSQWTLGSFAIPQRPRASSEIRLPFYDKTVYESNDKTWYGQSASIKQIEMFEKLKHGKTRSRTLPVQEDFLIDSEPSNIFARIRKTFTRSKDRDIEKQDVVEPKIPKRCRAFSECVDYFQRTEAGRPSVLSLQEQNNVEKIAELLLELTSLPPDTPKRKLGTASLTPPEYEDNVAQSKRTANKPIFQSRRPSFIPGATSSRRFSLRPVITTEDGNPAPPPYTEKPRRFSLKPATVSNATPSPILRQILKTTNKDQIKEGEPT